MGTAGSAFRQPWVVVFAFGLLHGLGFAGALSDSRRGSSQIPGEQSGEQRDAFGVNLREPQRTPTDFGNAQVSFLPKETGPWRTLADANGL